MANKALDDRDILPHHTDSVRVVPLYIPEEVNKPIEEAGVATTPPQLTYRNGPLLASVEVFTVYWGGYWKTAAGSAVAKNINGFFDYILSSPLLDQLAEYSVAAYKIGHGKHVGSAVLSTAATKRSITDSAIQHYLQLQITSNSAFPSPDPNTLYFIYMPPSVKVIQGGSSSCQAFCGYHNGINNQIFYAVMPYPNCTGCTGSLATLDALTSTSSHELCEAITDPIPGQGWYDDTHGEIGDICAWKTKKLGNYTVQLEWSNKANSCL
jgi:hypothetical protein